MTHSRHKGGSRKRADTQSFRRNASYRDDDRQSTLRHPGIAVFREIGTSGQLELGAAMEVFEATTRSCVRVVRGLHDKPPALNQLQINEVKENQPLGHLATGQAIDALYKKVPSLRKRLAVNLGTVGVFGNPRSNPMCYIGIALDSSSIDPVNQERKNIISTLEELAQVGADEECYWLERKVPHISLGMIPSDTPLTEVGLIKEGIRRSIPAQLVLRGATLYDPM